MNETPVLYILMRTDLASMNPGKAMAQASHASNAFWKKANDGFINKSHSSEKEHLLNIWQIETNQGFGTVLVLEVNEQQLFTRINLAVKYKFIADTVLDPTYPIIDGDIVHNIPLCTCGYIFGDKNNIILNSIVRDLLLHE